MANPSTTPSSIDAMGHRVPDGNEVVSRVAQSAHETVDRLAEKAAPAAQKLESTVAHANEVLHQQAAKARQLGDEWTDNLRGTVRENPLTAVGVALAVGMIFARLTR